MRARAVLALSLALVDAPLSSAQEKAKTPPVFTSKVEVVAVDIGVVDANGRPVKGLGPADFELSVDGKPRRVLSSEFVSETPDEDAPAPVPALAHFTSNEGLAPGRLVLIVVDAGNIALGSGREAILSAGTLLDQLGPNDRVGLLTLPGPEPRQEFTADRERVREALSKVLGQARLSTRRVSLSEALAYDENDDPERWASAVNRECFQGDPDCVRELRMEAQQMAWSYRDQSRRSLATLSAMFNVLRDVEGHKVVVLVTQGLGMSDAGSRPGRVSSEVRELSLTAAAARVSFFAVLVPSGSRIAADANLPPDVIEDDRYLHTQGVEQLALLARGAVFRGYADQAFARVAREISGYYLLGFEPEGNDRNGKTHDIKVKVLRPDVTVRNRRAVTLMPPGDAKAAERALVASLRAPVAAVSVPLRVATYSVRDANAAKVRVLISAEIGHEAVPQGLAVAWALLDGRGRVAASSVQSERGAFAAAVGPVPFTAAATVAPGLYTLRVAVRDDAGRQGSVEHPVKAALVEVGRLETSDLMLGLPPAAGTGLRPGLGLTGGAGPLLAHLELYGEVRGVTVTFEVSPSAGGPTLRMLPGRIAALRGRTVVQGLISLAGLGAGDYVVRAQVLIDGQPAGTETHPFRITQRQAAFRDGSALRTGTVTDHVHGNVHVHVHDRAPAP